MHPLAMTTLGPLPEQLSPNRRASEDVVGEGATDEDTRTEDAEGWDAVEY